MIKVDQSLVVAKENRHLGLGLFLIVLAAPQEISFKSSKQMLTGFQILPHTNKIQITVSTQSRQLFTIKIEQEPKPSLIDKTSVPQSHQVSN